MRRHLRRPSAALVVAFLALVVALGGTALAGPVAQLAKTIKGSSIKPHSIKGNRLVNNTLTGTQIKESALGKVPSAANADTAGHAGSATTATTALNAANAGNSNTVGGVGASGFVPASKLLRYSLAMNKGDAPKTFKFGPLTFTATCVADVANTDAKLTVQTRVSHLNVNSPFSDTDFNVGETATWDELDSAAANNYTSEEPRLYDPAGSFTVFDGDGEPTGMWVNTTGADCRFQGHLVNDAG